MILNTAFPSYLRASLLGHSSRAGPAELPKRSLIWCMTWLMIIRLSIPDHWPLTTDHWPLTSSVSTGWVSAPPPLTAQAGATHPNVLLIVTDSPLSQPRPGHAVPGGHPVPGSLNTQKNYNQCFTYGEKVEPLLCSRADTLSLPHILVSPLQSPGTSRDRP